MGLYAIKQKNEMTPKRVEFSKAVFWKQQFQQTKLNTILLLFHFTKDGSKMPLL